MPDLPPPAARFPPPPAHGTPAELQAYEQARWNHFLLDADWRRIRFNTQPNSLVVEAVRDLAGGLALDVNMGEGRNALYLAQLGWQVTGVDIAEKALAFAQQRARELGLSITTVAQDTNMFDWGRSRWDLLVLCYADDRAHVAQAQAALRPGGLLVFENFHADINQVRPSAIGQRMGFATDELPSRYEAAGFQIIRYEEAVGVADFSREAHRLVKLIARKN